MLSTNLDGVFLGTRHALRFISADTGGCIVNVASAAGVKPIVGNAAYGTSKAAIRFFTQIAALEGRPRRIRVNSISPGAMATPMWEATELWPRDAEQAGGRDAALNAFVKDKDFAKLQAIARAILFLVDDESRHLTGIDLPADDGFVIT